mmetsp:Transcript_51000/g.90674  ORF Transcript_51000/g.90674 Transcript_51000/m.90674 type:complete len:641 (+) Transcript_51000:67-1989(+)
MHVSAFVLLCLASGALAVSGRRLQAAASHAQGSSLRESRTSAKDVKVRKPKQSKAVADLLLAFNHFVPSRTLRRGLATRHAVGNRQHAASSNLPRRVPQVSLELKNASAGEAQLLNALHAVEMPATKETATSLTVENLSFAFQNVFSTSDTSDSPFATLMKNQQGNEASGPSDRFITDRLPVLQKIKPVLMPVFFIYCLQKGWIGRWGLFFAIFSRSYFDTLAVPLRVLPDSPLQGQAFLISQAWLNIFFSACNYGFRVATGKTSPAESLRRIKNAFKEQRESSRQELEETQQQATGTQQQVDMEAESNTSSASPSMNMSSFFNMDDGLDASDKFLTDRLPILQKPKKLLLLFFYGYCFQKGWIGNYGLAQGFLFSKSYFDVLAVPLRVLPESPVCGKAFFVTQWLVEMTFRISKFLIQFATNSSKYIDPAKSKWAEIQGQIKEAKAESEEKKAQLPGWMGGGNTTGNPMNPMMAQGNATDAFLTNRIPILKKSKRAILVIFFALCYWKGWVGRYGAVYGALLTKSYFEMLAVPLRVHTASPFHSALIEKPYYLAAIYTDLAFRAIEFVLKLLRGENPFADFMAQFKEKMAEAQQASSDEAGVVDVTAKREPPESKGQQGSSDEPGVIDVKAKREPADSK